MIFPEIFITGIIPEGTEKAAVCASALGAWACCMGGVEPPEKFGLIMVEVGKYLGCFPTPEGLEEYAKQQGWLS